MARRNHLASAPHVQQLESRRLLAWAPASVNLFAFDLTFKNAGHTFHDTLSFGLSSQYSHLDTQYRRYLKKFWGGKVLVQNAQIIRGTFSYSLLNSHRANLTLPDYEDYGIDDTMKLEFSSATQGSYSLVDGEGHLRQAGTFAIISKPTDGDTGAQLNAGVLNVSGSVGDDYFELAAEGDQLVVSRSNVEKRHYRNQGDAVYSFPVDSVIQRFTVASVQSIKGSCNSGDDFFIASNVAIPAYLLGGAGDDNLQSGDRNDTLIGESGNDTFTGSGGVDRLYGKTGDDLIDGDEGSDKIYGGGGDDYLDGGHGDDKIYGGDGNDNFWGDAGQDSMYGEKGDDSFNAYNISVSFDGELDGFVEKPDLVDGGAGYDDGEVDETDILRNMEDAI